MNRYASDYAQYQPSSSTNSASGSRSFLDNSTYLGVPSRQSYQMGSQDRSGNGNSLHYTTNPSSSEPSVLFLPPPPPNASAARSTSVSIASSHMISTTSAPVYQIDFAAKEIGKRIASSKRRISWRYGFPNQRALEQGHTGMACRGLEHEVVLIWSVTSGKRTILEDNREVVYSLSRGAKFEHSWTTREGMVIKLIAYDFIDNSPTGLQYDLLIHGQSFFKFPKIHELGLVVTNSNYAPHNTILSPFRMYNDTPHQTPVNQPHTSSYPSSTSWNRSDVTADLRDSMNASVQQTRDRMYR